MTYYDKTNGVSTHSRLKAAGSSVIASTLPSSVSTHSRLKAAGYLSPEQSHQLQSFNTQPPEGGWAFVDVDGHKAMSFNTQPPEGGWLHLQ